MKMKTKTKKKKKKKKKTITDGFRKAPFESWRPFVGSPSAGTGQSWT